MDLAEIHFTAGGERYEMTPPSPRLAMKASRLFGGIGTLTDRCQAGDLDAYAGVLRLACPAVAKLKESEREDFVFFHLAEVNTACTRWVIACQWGGREPHQVLADQEKTGQEGADGGDDADPLVGTGAAENR